jgi:TP901 family phage tail tape measure protein
MQNLELGETLEDGVNLTKYSKALEDVGVKVLDAKGQMRDMDDILSDLGEKWNGLGKTTQTAIAQTVGGIRQYNQMMALMNNWGDVQKNIEAAKESGGELAKQAAIWSESYEAAQERLTQAKNELYESFVNDKFLIILQDLGSVLVDRFADFTESIGGAVPLVLMLVGLFSKILFPTIRNAFAELRKNLDVITGKAQKDIGAVQSEMRKMM